jgi:hypothetical protein
MIDRFWGRVAKGGPDECWEWQRGTFGTGYGCYRHEGRNVYAHRLAWELTHGPIEDGLCVRHSCDNPLCVNPAHLLLGTDADNVRDKVERERQHRGEGSPMSKLTDSAVRCIRALYAERQADQKKLAELYGVDQAQISRIVSGKAWRHVR